MVSFFGLKVGGKKKKPDGKSAQEPQQPKCIDQNALGEGQFFGQNINKQQGVINGSIQSVSRAGTPQPGRTGSRAPYANHDTHNLAAASMFDLSAGGPARPGSQASVLLKPHSSDVNMRTRFGTQNGSSTSLAAPAPGFGARFAARNGSSGSLTAPTFGPRFGANNGSSTSLAAPGPGFGSRPGTPSRTKAWVNPLDVHFARSVPSGPPTPKSPLVGSMQLPPTPTTDTAETGSVFGEEADDMVDAVMASVKKREEQEREAKKREKELERQRETARLEMERLERQKSTESTLSARRPSAPQLEPQPKLPETPDLQLPTFRGDSESRPSSRNGPVRPPPVHQGPPPTGPPTQCLPQPPGQGPPRQGPLGLAAEDASLRAPRQTAPAANGLGPGPRPNGFTPLRSRSHDPLSGPLAQRASPGPPRSVTQIPPQKAFRPYRPPPLQGCGPLGALSDGPRAPSPPFSTPGEGDLTLQSPTLGELPSVDRRPTVSNSEPEIPTDSRQGTPAPEKQGLGPLISSLTSPSTVTSPSGSLREMPLDDGPVEQFARPIIRNVIAKRDTLTLLTPRQQSLSMRIEELEKTLIKAQATNQPQKVQATDVNRSSTGSSVYSDGIKDEDEDDDGPILTIHPAPLRVLQPTASAAAAAAAINRPQSPMRGPPRRGPLPRRPALEEYGVSSVALRTRGGTPTPASRSGSTDNYSTHSSPPSRTNTPQLRHPNWRRDLNQPSPAPTVDTFEQQRPNPVVDTGFKFDFGPTPNLGAPPTPDSTTWSLASPVGELSAAPPPPPTSDPSQTQATTATPASEPPTKFTRANVPPPLNLTFNFSPDAPSRDPSAGMWTPPIRSVPFATPTADGRPSTSSGMSPSAGSNKLAASPSLISQFPESSLLSVDDNRASFMGIGMARGPSIREVRRPKTAGGRKTGAGGMVDSFGTGFI